MKSPRSSLPDAPSPPFARRGRKGSIGKRVFEEDEKAFISFSPDSMHLLAEE